MQALRWHKVALDYVGAIREDITWRRSPDRGAENPPREAGMVQQFAKRRNADGTMDSICLKCFRTVARCTDQLELIEFEKDHQCLGIDGPPSDVSGNVVQFPPDRMIENHRCSQQASDPAAKFERLRERIRSRK